MLVNNAGMAVCRSIDDLTEADFDATIAVNLKSAFLCMHAVLPHMRAQRWGRIANISSGAARGGGAIGLHYNASKAGMEGLTRGYAARLVKEGITVNAIAPSLVETEMMPAARVDAGARIPLGRLGRPEEVRMDHRRALGRGRRRYFGRGHEHPPPCGRDVDANDEADRLLHADDAAKKPEQRGTCEIDDPVDDHRDSLRWLLVPDALHRE